MSGPGKASKPRTRPTPQECKFIVDHARAKAVDLALDCAHAIFTDLRVFPHSSHLASRVGVTSLEHGVRRHKRLMKQLARSTQYILSTWFSSSSAIRVHTERGDDGLYDLVAIVNVA